MPAGLAVMRLIAVRTAPGSAEGPPIGANCEKTHIQIFQRNYDGTFPAVHLGNIKSGWVTRRCHHATWKAVWDVFKRENKSMIELSKADTFRFGKYFYDWLKRGLILARESQTSEQAQQSGDASGVEMMTEFRKRYGSPLLQTFLLYKKTVLVLDQDLANQILTMAEAPNGPIRQSSLNEELFDSFQPQSLVISDGMERKRRRAFNECVLDTPSTEPTRHDPKQPVHEFQSAFLRKISETTDEYLSLADGQLSWQDFSESARIATFRIILGDNCDEVAMLGFMGQLERIITDTAATGGVISDYSLFGLNPGPRRTKKFRAKLETFLGEASANSLSARISGCEGSDDPVSDALMWLFALKDALDTHLPRALALILAHPEVYARVRDELRDKNFDDADDINQLSLLEGCVHETLRLWTPVQLILKETSDTPVALGEFSLPPDIHLAIHAAFLSRDPNSIENADAFDPDRWKDGAGPSLFHFSWGPRRCAGSHIALFAMKAVLARVLAGETLTLKSPQLDPHGKIPQLYDHFALEIRV